MLRCWYQMTADSVAPTFLNVIVQTQLRVSGMT